MKTRSIDAKETLSKLRAKRALSQRVHYHRSQLTPWRCELVALRRAGATLAELVHWLQFEKCRKVAPSTISRYLSHLPELQEGCDNGKA